VWFAVLLHSSNPAFRPLLDEMPAHAGWEFKNLWQIFSPLTFCNSMPAIRIFHCFPWSQRYYYFIINLGLSVPAPLAWRSFQSPDHHFRRFPDILPPMYRERKKAYGQESFWQRPEKIPNGFKWWSLGDCEENDEKGTSGSFDFDPWSSEHPQSIAKLSWTPKLFAYLR